jgi:hypothetical protein
MRKLGLHEKRLVLRIRDGLSIIFVQKMLQKQPDRVFKLTKNNSF